MNNSNSALRYNDTYENVKKVDASALKDFFLYSVNEIVELINYWSNKRRQLTAPEQEAQKYACDMEIIRLESILLARTTMTIDLFNISNIDEIKESVESLGSLQVTKKETNDTLPFEEKKEAKVVSIVQEGEKIPYKTIIETCKNLIKEGKEEEALDYANYYFSTGNYIPRKHFEKAKPWAHARVVDLISNLINTVKAEAKRNAETNKDKTQKQEQGKENKTDVVINIPVSDYDKFHKFLVDSGYDPKDLLTEDLLDENKRKEIDSFDIIGTSKDFEKLVKQGINAKIVEEEEEELSAETFKNKSGLLAEELAHLTNLLNICMNKRGPVTEEAKNVEEIKKICEMFFSTRSKEDYPNQNNLISVITKRPLLASKAEDVFTITRSPEYALRPYSENKNYDMYESLKERARKATDEEFESLKKALIGKLKGHIVQGKDDKNSLINKSCLYTRYHALSFLVEARNEKPTPTVASTKTSAVSTSTSDKSISTEQPVAKESVINLISKLEEALFRIIKNGGIFEDAFRSEEFSKLKGKTVKDKNGKDLVLDSEENMKAYLTYKFEEAEERYERTRTNYPLKDMTTLITRAVENNIPVEDFVRENISLIKRKNGTFIPIKDSGKNSPEVEYIITSDKDFEEFVRKSYDLYKEVSNVENKTIKYEKSEFQSLLEFEKALKEKLSKEGNNNNIILWAKEKILDKTFSEVGTPTPLFTTDKIENFNTYINALLKDFDEKKDNKEDDTSKLRNFIKNVLKNINVDTTRVASIVQQAKKFAAQEKISTNLKSLLNLVIEISKEENKAFYDKYIKEKEALEKEELIPASKPEETVEKKESTENKKVVMTKEEGDKSSTKNLILACKDVKSEEDLNKVLNSVNVNSIPIQDVVRAAKFIFNNNLKSLNKTEEYINSFVNKLYNSKDKKEETKEENKGEIKVDNSLFEKLSSANDKMSFKSALRKIVETYEDSAKIREKIIESIKSSTKGHAAKIASQNVTDMHKMIKRAYENLEENK